ncbi:hypothetical protein IFT84_01750 [Rhizobium sp. CFBP 8762]|uniref:hypothetical protein n=1 Tax=Rhizobium sp. CFBP 8762 TaxID=2775279 RepID=UPI001786E701|nr:hypothetical protein [Rhizobium sp. CFBP 8762]
MSGTFFRSLCGLSLLAVLAGCNQTGGGILPKAPPAAGPAVVQGKCPQVYLRDGTATHRVFTKGGEGDATKIIYQASLVDTTRQCTTSGDQLTITVQAQGRALAGPAGKAGPVKLPIRVAVTDGNNTVYSQLTQMAVDIPAGSTTNQFVFTKTDVTIPANLAEIAKVYVGFDEGPGKK